MRSPGSGTQRVIEAFEELPAEVAARARIEVVFDHGELSATLRVVATTVRGAGGRVSWEFPSS